MPGKLVNSNKIMVLLGENYFIGKKVLFFVKLMLIECCTVPNFLCFISFRNPDLGVFLPKFYFVFVYFYYEV